MKTELVKAYKQLDSAIGEGRLGGGAEYQERQLRQRLNQNPSTFSLTALVSLRHSRHHMMTVIAEHLTPP